MIACELALAMPPNRAQIGLDRQIASRIFKVPLAGEEIENSALGRFLERSNGFRRSVFLPDRLQAEAQCLNGAAPGFIRDRLFGCERNRRFGWLGVDGNPVGSRLPRRRAEDEIILLAGLVGRQHALTLAIRHGERQDPACRLAADIAAQQKEKTCAKAEPNATPLPCLHCRAFPIFPGWAISPNGAQARLLLNSVKLLGPIR